MNPPPLSPLEVEQLAFGPPEERPPLSFRVEPGQCLTLTGANGSGKSHLLAILVGLATSQHGTIRFYGQPYPSPRERRSYAARIGVGFQHSGLIESLTVFQNAALPYRTAECYRRHRRSEAEIARETDRRLAQLGLREIAPLYPHQLSNGERKAVALARALALSPRLLLLDEPFLSLGAELKHRATALLGKQLASGRLDAVVLFSCEPIQLPDAPGITFPSVDLCSGPIPAESLP